MVPVIGAVRAYFGPVNKNTGTPTPFDASQDGRFDLDMPPSGWTSLGWIGNLKRTDATKYAAVRTGTQALTTSQVRTAPEALIQFEMREWGKLELALACGTQHFNLLAETNGSVIPAIYLQAGSTAQSLNTATQGQFQTGDWVAVDVDYSQQTGYIGSGVSAAYVSTPQSQTLGVDYIRRVTLNVAKVASATAGQLLLEKPLLGGAPVQGAGVQKVIGFSDREGSSYFQEWSGLFVADGAQRDRVCFYYPRLQAAAGAIEAERALTPELAQLGLTAQFRALPVVDALDGESVLCYRTYLPAV
jgi:hypothetical protein